MRRRPDIRWDLVEAMAIVAGALLALALVASALSAPPTAWRLGALDLGAGASWWWGEAATTPDVAVDRGEAWAWCDGDGACVIVAQGPWARLTADGATVWRRGRAYLPMLTTTTRPEGP